MEFSYFDLDFTAYTKFMWSEKSSADNWKTDIVFDISPFDNNHQTLHMLRKDDYCLRIVFVEILQIHLWYIS